MLDIHGHGLVKTSGFESSYGNKSTYRAQPTNNIKLHKSALDFNPATTIMRVCTRRIFQEFGTLLLAHFAFEERYSSLHDFVHSLSHLQSSHYFKLTKPSSSVIHTDSIQ